MVSFATLAAVGQDKIVVHNKYHNLLGCYHARFVICLIFPDARRFTRVLGNLWTPWGGPQSPSGDGDWSFGPQAGEGDVTNSEIN